jgi:D-beta-D-heptose 7-phosphate kinase/D-beta-D-heptose 1-phosphate adenosyltransferase
MSANLLNIIERFSRIRVLVLGDAMLDRYIGGCTDRLCREAPVPVIAVNEEKYVPGGAANTAVNLRSLGAAVTFLSVIGDDDGGRLLARLLKDREISSEQIVMRRARSTIIKHRIMAENRMIARLDQGTTTPLQRHDEEEILGRLPGLYRSADLTVISDYSYGMLTPAIIALLRRLGEEHPGLLAIDAKDVTLYRSLRPTLVKPNYREALQLLGIAGAQLTGSRINRIADSGDRILQLTGAPITAVTLDNEGALVFEQGRPLYRTYARPHPDTSATGAGDTFISAFALALACGADTTAGAELASAAASVVVEKNETAACSARELKGAITSTSKRLSDLSSLEAVSSFYRHEGKKIVFTNGCFDILHRGHVTCLSRAKSLGDILIVGVNTDESVRRLKGATRPINRLEDRLRILSALSCVDHVIDFDSDTSSEIIRTIRPDLFVKGGDYTSETLPEARLVESLGGTVTISPYIDNCSTTGIIEQIRQRKQLPAREEAVTVP